MAILFSAANSLPRRSAPRLPCAQPCMPTHSCQLDASEPVRMPTHRATHTYTARNHLPPAPGWSACRQGEWQLPLIHNPPPPIARATPLSVFSAIFGTMELGSSIFQLSMKINSMGFGAGDGILDMLITVLPLFAPPAFMLPRTAPSFTLGAFSSLPVSGSE